ncbi:YajQ family cyclic di-GMP-binding protein [Bacillus horti]|uniref:Nucleotide-binding protein J2S11_000693 n=1 Tax=Caldalkalibacillus horti TaxID=77523 RepID=A0ABT9VUZ0_9BACI|nr:YajQ family cyclic di-GMP-binding protein [Bacillus horti]MDQ0164793.1 uncharacterized protein YajQ (UPF0234 family) [Bacillus horti]
MAKDNSFDIVSEINLQEVDNAIQQTKKEIENRYDFKGSKSELKRDEQKLTITSEDEYKINSVVDILQSKLIKRQVSIKALHYGKVEPASGGMARQQIDLVQGIDQDRAKKITKLVKESKIKVQVQIQGEQLRVSGKNRDDLQQVMQMIRESDLDIPVQFVNYR